MAKYIGNLTDLIDFKRLLLDLRPGAIDQLYIYSNEDENDHTYNMNQPLRDAGYNDPAWDGITYSPVTHFDREVIVKLNEALGAMCTACWISELSPGHNAPPHRDIDFRDTEFQKYGNLVRYAITMGEPDQGHAFFVDNQCIHNQESGAAFKWDDPHSLHSGANAGLTPKFIIIYAGIELFDNVTAEYIWDDEKLKTLDTHRHKFLNLKLNYN